MTSALSLPNLKGETIGHPPISAKGRFIYFPSPPRKVSKRLIKGSICSTLSTASPMPFSVPAIAA